MVWVFLLLVWGVSACGPREDAPQYYMVAERITPGPPVNSKVTFIRTFEKKHWCEADTERFMKQDFKASCRTEERIYEPALRGEAIGKWYILQKIGRFPPSAVVYEYDPPLPDAIMLAQLKRFAPHAVKFAALHRAPAESLIYSPSGDIRSQKMLFEEETQGS